MKEGSFGVLNVIPTRVLTVSFHVGAFERIISRERVKTPRRLTRVRVLSITPRARAARRSVRVRK